MTNSTHLYGQLFGFLRQYSRAAPQSLGMDGECLNLERVRILNVPAFTR